MKGIPYKDTFAAKGSDLCKALEEGDMQKAKAIYDATTARMKALSSAERNVANGDNPTRP